jgi:anti-anti-sigma regulatory factor
MTIELTPEAEVAALKTELEDSRAALAAAALREDEYHAATMDLALGLSECFQILTEARGGNLAARVSASVLESPDEVIANLGGLLNDTISDFEGQIELIRRQTIAIQELSTPVLQLWTDVLALPVIGMVDSRRAAEIMERLLSEIVTRKSRFVILDITGVEVVDTKTADHFIKLIRAASLLGTECIVTGIRPAVAQTLVELGVDLSAIATLRDLHAGLHHCLKEMSKQRAQESPAAG